MKALPPTRVDTAFGGWDGSARLQIAEDLAVAITTEPVLHHHHLYSAGEQADFVCFEPVSHPVNAHNTPGYPGLEILAKDEVMRISVGLTPIEPVLDPHLQ